MRSFKEARDLTEWLEAARQGEDALVELEAQRQAARLERDGFTHAFRETDICAGGKKIAGCETAGGMFRDAKDYAAQQEDKERTGEGTYWTTLAWLSKRCGECALSCGVAYKSVGGKPTDEVRFINAKPLDDLPIILALEKNI